MSPNVAPTEGVEIRHHPFYAFLFQLGTRDTSISDTLGRPLVFIFHDLGGIFVSKAFVDNNINLGLRKWPDVLSYQCVPRLIVDYGAPVPHLCSQNNQVGYV